PFSRPRFVFPPAEAVQPTAHPETIRPIPAPPIVPTPRAPASIVPRRATPIAPVAPSVAQPKPASQPAVRVAPLAGDTTVTIRPRDSLWKLSRQYLGKGSRWHDWLAINPGLASPDRIQPGTILLRPAVTATLSRASSNQTQPGTISVKSGDSLWKLARTHLGSGSQWLCLAQANPQLLHADHIYVGQTLSLPASCRTTP